MELLVRNQTLHKNAKYTTSVSISVDSRLIFVTMMILRQLEPFILHENSMKFQLVFILTDFLS
jgi:hypothetical protein